jgi:hypothetical protein
VSQSRAKRLAELQAEVAKAAGYDGIADMSGPDRQRAAASALLRLQHEVCAAKLLNGGELVTNELIALSEAIASTLPAKRAAPFVVEFVSSSHPEANMGQVRHLEEQLELARKRIAALEGGAPVSPSRAEPPQGQQTALPPESNVVPMPPRVSAESIAMLNPALDTWKRGWPEY